VNVCSWDGFIAFKAARLTFCPSFSVLIEADVLSLFGLNIPRIGLKDLSLDSDRRFFKG